MERQDTYDSRSQTPTSLSPSTPCTPTAGKSLSRLRPLAEETEPAAADGHAYDGNALCVVSLNLGGRNTNPVEFILKGDSSEMAVEATSVLRKAGKAMRSAEEGPLMMPAAEMRVVEEIIDLMYKDTQEEVPSEWQSKILELFRCETWQQVLASVKATNAHAFNALNLSTLKLNRPSVWENPASCKDFTNTLEYLAAWKQWYCDLDRAGQFWLEHAPRVAKKRGMEVPMAFAGLLVFDVMSLCSARCSMSSAVMEDDFEDLPEDTRRVPFAELAKFAAKLPASSLTARHACARKFMEGAHAVLAQEARSFADVMEEFLPPFCALDGFTAVFLRKVSFTKAADISGAVMRRMEELVDKEAPLDSQKAWRTTGSRLAAVCCQAHPDLGGSKLCLVSLHASKSDCTAAFIERLRDVLEDYDADINVVGMDSNCTGEEESAFQKRLRGAGFEIGCTPKQQQVTVAKQRTAFQTQIQKVGDVDVSHKDYIVSWTSPRVRRGPTTYTPDLRTCYGVEQETKQCVRLPTTKWPFDHCGVITTFQPKFRCKGNLKCRSWSLRFCALVLFLCLLAAAPLASGVRKNPYGQPGVWLQDAYIFNRRRGICEAPLPCPDGWLKHGDSCYVTTPSLSYPDVQGFCEGFNGSPIAIGSEEENRLVIEWLCPKGTFCYIGLLGGFDGTNSWATGEAYNFTRLVEEDASSLPLFENSRSTDYVATVVSNLRGELDGCDIGFSFYLANTNGDFMYSKLDVLICPTVAMLVSGVFLALPRPPGQRLASSLLLLGFVVNTLWLLPRLLTSCFADNYATLRLVTTYGYIADSGGHAAQSLLSLWMIVRRMCMLYPARSLKRIFWTLIACINVLFMNSTLHVDSSAPIAATWPVILMLSVQAVIIVLYVTASGMIASHLYRTWACLHEEATQGYNAQGKILRQSVRDAKLHLFTVCLAIMTGAVRWGGLLAVMIGFLYRNFPVWIGDLYMFGTCVDSITNDVCAHLLACKNMDAAVIDAKGITREVAERAEREVEQHRLAVRMLKAAPTSDEQLQQLSELESKARAAVGTEQEKSAFLILQSAVRVETARIHRLMQCVRVRAMTMGLRYQYLIEVPSLEATPRQHVPEKFMAEQSEVSASKYFSWLYGEAAGAQQVFFQHLQQLLTKFNDTEWPSYLGLAPEEFPWRIWSSSSAASMNRLQKGEVISPGDTLVHCRKAANCVARTSLVSCIVLEETAPELAKIHCSGAEAPEEVPREELRTCRGRGVFVPGPRKKEQRCFDKIAVDYEGTAPWPAAASLVDLCRCTLVCDDPYAVAVLVAYLRKNMKVVRVKNRFSEDVLESHGAEDLQSMFYAAADATASDTMTNPSTTQSSGEQQYRDVSMNVAIRSPSGVPVICEIQVTLSNLAILKGADQKLYTVRRMKSPSELPQSQIFEAGKKAAGC